MLILEPTRLCRFDVTLSLILKQSWLRVMQLMDHEDERRKDQKAWMMNHVLVVIYLQKILTQAAAKSKTGSKGPYFNSKQIQKVIGLLRTNGVKLEGKKGVHCSKVGLYPIYSLTNHNCIDCNTRTFKVTKDNHVSGKQLLVSTT